MESTLPELTQLVAEARRYQPAPVPTGATLSLILNRHFVPVDDLAALLRTHDDLPWDVAQREGSFWATLSIKTATYTVGFTLFADYNRAGKTLPEIGRS
jgi:hypothetical protein